MIPHQKRKRKKIKKPNSLQVHAQLSKIMEMEVKEQLETLNLKNLSPKFDI